MEHESNEKIYLPNKNNRKRVVIACRVMQRELNAAKEKLTQTIEIRYLNQNLHRTPDKMPGVIQAEIDAVADCASDIVLGYGLCSNGIVGVYAPAQPLYVPRAHDCVALLMGSRKSYEKAFRENPGTYYLSPGWILEEKDPLGIMETEYAPRMGKKEAEWGIREELKHYSRIVLIDTGVMPPAYLQERARENARFLKKDYGEISGDPIFFKKLLNGPYHPEEFFCYEPGERIKQQPFLK
ncbi:MAG: DUF1638 domain-containing protein [Desulfobacterales bacterium]